MPETGQPRGESRPAAGRETGQMEWESRPVGRRETRLLLATIAVSIAVLLLLARFRFPEEAARQTTDASPAPLDRLAARATYDELASIMVDLERRVVSSLVVVGTQANGTVTYAPAVRILPDRAVAVVPRDRRVVPIGKTPQPQVLARDAVRELIVMQMPARPDAVATIPSVAPRPGPRYLTVIEATAQGPAVRPVYVGRTELFADPRWSDPVLAVTAIQQTLPSGAAVFSLDGGFIGLVAESSDPVTLIPASTLLSVARAAPAVPAPRGELPIDVQPLTPALARAAGAEKGVMVSYVRPGPGAGDLAPGDVIQSIDGIGVTTVAGFQQIEQSRAPGAPVTITAMRRGQPLTVKITAGQAEGNQLPASDDLGAVLRSVPGTGAEVVTIQPGSVALEANLRAGDVIIALEQTSSPDAGAIQRAFRVLPAGEALLLTIRRGTEHRVLAVEKR